MFADKPSSHSQGQHSIKLSQPGLNLMHPKASTLMGDVNHTKPLRQLKLWICYFWMAIFSEKKNKTKQKQKM